MSKTPVTQNRDMRRGGEVMVYKAHRMLQYKAGTGELSTERIKNAAEIATKIDYRPFHEKILDELGELLEKNKTSGGSSNFADDVRKIVVSLKSSAGIFGYMATAELTRIMLDFLESHRTFDRDIYDIVAGHHHSLVFVLQKDLRDADCPEVRTLKEELYDACNRYASRREG